MYACYGYQRNANYHHTTGLQHQLSHWLDSITATSEWDLLLQRGSGEWMEKHMLSHKTAIISTSSEMIDMYQKYYNNLTIMMLSRRALNIVISNGDEDGGHHS